MWTVIYIAQSNEIAVRLKDVLEKEGVLVKIKPIGKNAEGAAGGAEVLVPETELSQAHDIIIETGF